MDDSTLQEWSQELAELRLVRQTSVNKMAEEKANEFAPADFFDIAMGSINEILEKWFAAEQRSWAGHPPADMEPVRAEMDSVIDFEVEAIYRDLGVIPTKDLWTAGDLAKAEEQFQAFAKELRKKYELKLASPAAAQKKRERVADTAPLPTVQASYTRSGSSGFALIVMFLVGLVFGGGASVYFWDQAQRAKNEHQEERAKALTEQRTLEDSVTLLNEMFQQLASGKIKNVPELERDIKRIQASATEQRSKIEREATRERERTLKKIPAGSRLDKALEDLEAAKKNKLADIDAQEAAALEPITKQRDRLRGLMVR